MFTFTPRLNFSTPVSVQVPGVAEPQVFTGHFTALPQDETIALQDPTAPRDRVAANNRDWLDRIFTGWGPDLVDDRGAPVPVSAEVKAQLLNQSWVCTAITLAYLREVAGVARKN